MSLTVKAYVLPGRAKNEFEEIRRFTITNTDVKDFKKLFQKVCEVFPNLDEDKTSLHWKDNEGDLIHFTTNSELAEAIKSVTDGVFRLFAREKPLFKDNTQLHLGVVCGNCKQPVEGSRYKCLACDDYDLCHSCEIVGTHLEHTMIKIPTPTAPWVAQIMQFSYTFGPSSPMSPMLVKCRTDASMRHIIPLPIDDQSSPEMDRPSFASGIGQPFSRNDWSLFNDTPLSKRSCIGQASAMEDYNLSHDEMQSRPGRTTDLDSLDIVNKSSGRESLFSYNESPPDKTSGDWTIVNSSSKSNGITSTSSTSSAKIQAETTRVTEFSSRKEASSIKVASVSEMTSSSPKLGKREQEKSLMGSDDMEEENDQNWNEDSTATDGTDNETVKTTTAADDGGAVPSREDTVSSTTKDSKEEKEETTTEGSKDPKPIVDNNLYYPKVRRYADALDNLMSMGFTNEGGWLTVLVEEKRGDIIRVLDFIENNIQKCRENEEAKSRN